MEILQPSWRGRFLNTRKGSDGKKHIALVGEKSLLYTPVDVLPNAVYKLTLELHRESGNGLAYCNIYGNRRFDFPHVKLQCDGSSWNTYDIDLVTKDFPKTVPMVFRVWRYPSGTGTLLIRKIFVELVESGLPQEPILISKKSGPPPKIVEKLEQKETPKKVRRPPEGRKTKQKLKPKPEPKPKRSRRSYPPVLVTPEPKLLPIVIGDNGIKVSVVISLYNRMEFLNRTFQTYVKQTLPKKQFELVIIDDQSTEDIKSLCKEYAERYKLQFQYIRINKENGAIKPKGFTPALSNNIGFKHARGSVVVITGPESLQGEKNLELSWEKANEGKCIYGDIYRSSPSFVDNLRELDVKTLTFEQIIKIPGAKEDASVTKGWWWYYVAVRKEHLLAINGVDERFMEGITGEDDDFAYRMAYSGVPLVRCSDIIGIHQDHTREDKKDHHSIRYQRKAEWKRLREFSSTLLKDWAKSLNPVTNENIDWGSENAIIKKEIF